MSLIIKLVLFSAIVIVMSYGAIIYRALRRCDCMIFTFFGRHITIDNPFPNRSDNHHIILDAPHIRPINKFLFEFARSEEKANRITPEDITSEADVTPLIRALKGLEYEKIRLRLRLRVISNLNPVVNLKAEEATIRFSSRLSVDKEEEYEIRSIFAPKGESILLEKISSTT